MAFNKNKVMDAARKFVEKGQTDKAIKEYLRIVREDPKDVRVWLKIGDLYAKQGAKQEATETYLKVAKFYSEQGFYQKAVAVYKTILKLDPRMVEVNLKLAELYRQLGLLSDAMQHFEMVASHFHREGKTKEALATVRQLVDLDPENVATRIKLAELYSKESMTDEAVTEFGAACEYLRKNNRQDDFIKVAERLLWHKPDRVELNRELAGLYLRRNDPRRALQKLQVCFKADPRDVETLVLLAQAFQSLDQKSKTVSVLKELARVFDDTKQRAKAEDVHRKILQFVPTDPDSLAYLGGKVEQPVAAIAMAAGNDAIARAPTVAAAAAAAAGGGGAITGRPPAARGTGPAQTLSHAVVGAAARDRALTFGIENARVRAVGSPTGSVPLVRDPDEHLAELTADLDLEESSSPRYEGSHASEVHSEEISKILTETEVYVKYGLHAKAVEHLRRVFTLDPTNLEARERLKDILLSQGREKEAIAELMTLAEHCAPTDPDRAESHLREVLAIDGTHRPVFELARRFRLDLASGPQVEIVDDADGDGDVSLEHDDLHSGGVAVVDDADLDEADFSDIEPDDDVVAPDDDVVATADDDAALALDAALASAEEDFEFDLDGSAAVDLGASHAVTREKPGARPPRGASEDLSFDPAGRRGGPRSAGYPAPLADELAPEELSSDELALDLDEGEDAIEDDYVGEYSLDEVDGEPAAAPASAAAPFAAAPFDRAAARAFDANITAQGGDDEGRWDGDGDGDALDQELDAAVAAELDSGPPAPVAPYRAPSSGYGQHNRARELDADPIADVEDIEGDFAPPSVRPGAVRTPTPLRATPGAATPLRATPGRQALDDARVVTNTMSLEVDGDVDVEEIEEFNDAEGLSAEIDAELEDYNRDTDGEGDDVARVVVSSRQATRAPTLSVARGDSHGDLAAADLAIRTVGDNDPGTGTSLEDDLDESDFFVNQGLYDEAVDILHNLLARYGDHPLVQAKLQEVEVAMAGNGAVARAPSLYEEVESDDLVGEEAELDSTAEDAELDAALDDAGGDIGSPSRPTVTLERPIEEGDADTHYDLGLAYKEMGLFDEAIKAFGKVAGLSAREAQCRLMIGLCQREQGNNSEAVHQFKIGLHAGQISDRERQGLFYEIGLSYEALNDPKEALYYFDMVQKKEPSYRDVAQRVAQLRSKGTGGRSGAGDKRRGGGEDSDGGLDGLLSKTDRR